MRDAEFVNLDAAVVNLSLTDVQMHNSEFLLKNGGINVNGQSASFKTSLKRHYHSNWVDSSESEYFIL